MFHYYPLLINKIWTWMWMFTACSYSMFYHICVCVRVCLGNFWSDIWGRCQCIVPVHIQIICSIILITSSYSLSRRIVVAPPPHMQSLSRAENEKNVRALLVWHTMNDPHTNTLTHMLLESLCASLWDDTCSFVVRGFLRDCKRALYHTYI